MALIFMLIGQGIAWPADIQSPKAPTILQQYPLSALESTLSIECLPKQIVIIRTDGIITFPLPTVATLTTDEVHQGAVITTSSGPVAVSPDGHVEPLAALSEIWARAHHTAVSPDLRLLVLSDDSFGKPLIVDLTSMTVKPLLVPAEFGSLRSVLWTGADTAILGFRHNIVTGRVHPSGIIEPLFVVSTESKSGFIAHSPIGGLWFGSFDDLNGFNLDRFDPSSGQWSHVGRLGAEWVRDRSPVAVKVIGEEPVVLVSNGVVLFPLSREAWSATPPLQSGGVALHFCAAESEETVEFAVEVSMPDGSIRLFVSQGAKVLQ